MHHKWMVLFSTLVLFSLLIAPVGTAQAQDISPDCPPYEPGLLREKEVLRSLPVECVEAYKDAARQAGSGASGQDVGPMAVGGPDTFGYTYDDSVAYNWISATQNSGLIGDDEFTGPIDIGFDFPFYGITQSQLYFSTNGLISFGAGYSQSVTHDIPTDLNPNNFIAAFWEDLLIGGPYNSGAIYYSTGGSAPNRYLVIEWRNVERYYEDGTFSFEVVLYENGDIVVQHQSLPSFYVVTVGLENSIGSGGLKYLYGFSNLSALNAIRFSYPNTPRARLLAYAPQTGDFAAPGGQKDFPIVVINPGTLGADTYDLIYNSNWPVTFYASNGVTPLTNTDGDSFIDTGPIPVGGSTTIIARYNVPGNAQMGDTNFSQITFESSFGRLRFAPVDLNMAIPAEFAQVFQNTNNGAMSFLTVSAGATDLHKVTTDNYFGSNVAVAKLTNGNYFYVWDKSLSTASGWARDIESALLNGKGNLVLPPGKLTDNSNATMYTSDSSPSVAVAPNGTVGVIWSRQLYNAATDQYNYNIFFATLNGAGARLMEPISITNNAVWGDYDTVPAFSEPTLAATSDNRFILSYTYESNVWYAVRDTTGINILPPTALTSSGWTFGPVLNTLVDGKAVITWATSAGPFYAVINSDGTFSKPATSMSYYDGANSLDAVQLSNGKVALAISRYSSIVLVILNSSYTIEGTPKWVESPNQISASNISVTTDASNHVIMTWSGGYYSNKLLYALADSTGTFITRPVIYKTSEDSIDISLNGEGNAPYEPVQIISGNTGVGGITLRYTNGIAQTVMSDTNGNYSINVPVGWSGTVTPSKAGYAFTPSNRIYTNIQADQTDQNYTAEARSSADTTGVFRPSNGLLYLKNHNTTGFADVAINYGLGGDYPVVGDWDGDGDATIGIYRNGKFYLRNENTPGFADMVFAFGVPGDQPIAGDWDGDGMDTIGVYRPSAGLFLLRNSNDAGSAQMSFYLGNYGDVGIAGDWDGDGKDTTGVFRPSNGFIFLKNTNSTGYADIALNYGLPGDKPVTGDWDGNGTATIGIYRNGTFFLRNSNTIGFADLVFSLGNPGDIPIAGDWDGMP